MNVVGLPTFHPILLADCVYLGGFGFSLRQGQSTSLKFAHGEISASGLAPISYARVNEISISGPGNVTSGGGFIGGGFGVAGSLEGMALAGVLNAITTRTKIHTFVSITTHMGELHFHYAGMEPGALRIALSPVYGTLRRMSSKWVSSQFEGLRWNMENGQITEEEYTRFVDALNTGSAGGDSPADHARSESQIIAACEAQLIALGFQVQNSEPNKWEIKSKAGTTYAYSANQLRQRTSELAKRAGST